jgi:para-nitrobenzyl esterase
MQDAWVRFAATGDPNGGDLPAWPAYEAAADRHLEFGDAVRQGARWRRPQMDFLDGFFARRFDRAE